MIFPPFLGVQSDPRILFHQFTSFEPFLRSFDSAGSASYFGGGWVSRRNFNARMFSIFYFISVPIFSQIQNSSHFGQFGTLVDSLICSNSKLWHKIDPVLKYSILLIKKTMFVCFSLWIKGGKIENSSFQEVLFPYLAQLKYPNFEKSFLKNTRWRHPSFDI